MIANYARLAAIMRNLESPSHADLLARYRDARALSRMASCRPCAACGARNAAAVKSLVSVGIERRAA